MVVFLPRNGTQLYVPFYGTIKERGTISDIIIKGSRHIPQILFSPRRTTCLLNLFRFIYYGVLIPSQWTAAHSCYQRIHFRVGEGVYETIVVRREIMRANNGAHIQIGDI